MQILVLFLDDIRTSSQHQHLNSEVERDSALHNRREVSGLPVYQPVIWHLKALLVSTLTHNGLTQAHQGTVDRKFIHVLLCRQ